MEKGINTSEFYLVVIFMGLVALNGTEYVNVPWQEMSALGVAVTGYVGGRTWRKVSGRKE